MNVITKKIAAIALTLALALSVMGGTVATAEEPTIESLLAQIQQLQALIAQLQADDTTPTEPTGLPAACVNMTSFTRNLTVGSRGADVRCLQALLNMDPQTQVAASGVGSKGQETEYFGPLTRNAVIAFQNKHTATILAPIGLSAGTGFVGTQTRVKLDEMLKAPAPAPTPDPDPTDPDPTDPDPTDPDPTDPDDDEVVAEGDMDIKRLAEPGPAVEIGPGQTKAVLGFEVKALEGRVTVQRVDVYFEEDENRLWNVLDYVTLKADGNALSGMSATRANFTDEGSDVYKMRFQGFNVPVALDGTVDFTVEVEVRSDYDDEDGDNITVRLANEAVRAVDAIGIQQFGGANTIARTFEVSDESVSAKVSSNADTPEGVALASKTSSTRHEILRFDVELEDGDATLDEVTAILNFTSSTSASVYPASLNDLDLLFTTVRLYHGTTILEDVDIATQSYNATTGDLTVTFDDLDYDMTEGEETLRVDLGVRAMDVEDQAWTVTGRIEAGDVTFEDVDGDSFDSTGTATGETIGINVVAPEFSLVSGQYVYSGPSGDERTIGSAVLEFSIKAWGGDIYISDDPTVDLGSAGDYEVVISEGGNATSADAALDAEPGKSTVTEGGDTYYRITDGTTVRFTITAELEPTTGNLTALRRVYLESMNWYTKDSSGALVDFIAAGSYVENIFTSRLQ